MGVDIFTDPLGGGRGNQFSELGTRYAQQGYLRGEEDRKRRLTAEEDRKKSMMNAFVQAVNSGQINLNEQFLSNNNITGAEVAPPSGPSVDDLKKMAETRRIEHGMSPEGLIQESLSKYFSNPQTASDAQLFSERMGISPQEMVEQGAQLLRTSYKKTLDQMADETKAAITEADRVNDFRNAVSITDKQKVAMEAMRKKYPNMPKEEIVRRVLIAVNEKSVGRLNALSQKSIDFTKGR
jgi:hypothetical protein